MNNNALFSLFKSFFIYFLRSFDIQQVIEFFYIQCSGNLIKDFIRIVEYKNVKHLLHKITIYHKYAVTKNHYVGLLYCGQFCLIIFLAISAWPITTEE